MLPDPKARRILIVDSDLARVQQIGDLLEGAGYYVQNAYNAGDALFAVEHGRFDAALINVDMRDRGGTPFRDHLRENPAFSRLPIVPLNELAALREQEVLDRVAKACAGPDPRTAAPATASSNGQLHRELAELQALSALIRFVSSSLELSEVLNQIVDAATTLTNAEEGLLLLPDEAGTALYIRAMKGIDSESAHNFRIKTGDSLAWRVFTDGEPALIGARGPQKVKTEYFVHSLVYVPLTFKGQTIGVLGVNNRRTEKSFTAHDRDLLLDLAAHAAIALANARLYEQQVAQTRQLATLVEAGRAVNSTLALDKVLVSICQQIIHALAVSGCLISEVNTPTNASDPPELRMMAAVRRAAWPIGSGPALDLTARPVLQSALEQNMYYVLARESEQSNLHAERRYLDDAGADQIVVLPLRAEGQPVGVLELHYMTERNPVPDVTGDFRRGARTRALMISAATPHGALALAPTLLTQTGACRAVIWLFNGPPEGTRLLTRTLDYGESAWSSWFNSPHPRDLLFPATPDRLIGAGAQTTLAYTANDTYFPATALEQFGAQAILGVPLTLKGTPIGAVTLYDVHSPRRFTPAEIELAQAIISQAATAIENARLFHDLDRSLSELKAAQIKLVQAARLTAIGELAAVVAHQIDNPLTAVLGNAEFLLQDLADDDPKREPLDTIHRAGKRAHTVVSRLLSIARRGTDGEQLQAVEVHTTIRAVLELVTAYIQREQVALTVGLESTPLTVCALPGHLEDVWMNLLLNARYAVRGVPDAAILIQSWAADGYALVTVADNGPGIPIEHRAHLFDAFFTTKPAGEGTGLGLYICKQIVDRVGGTIMLDDDPTAPGARFTVRLPLADIPLPGE
ncbi:MAG: GAF domain-containing protein [Aggregatilineales bacterium]